MRSFFRNLLASTSLLAIAACGPSRLSDTDVTRLCTLQVRCGAGGTQEACEASTTSTRDAANAAGCGGQFGALGRCVIREDECALPAACTDEQDRLESCLSRPRADAGGTLPDVSGSTCVPLDYEEGVEACSDFCDNDGDDTADCNDTSCCASLLGECPSGTVCGAPATPSEARMTNGFLEVYYMSEWRSVCDDGFDQQDADVACRQMGYSGAETFMTSVAGTNDSFWLDDLACTGEESTLDACPSSGWGVENCSASESVSVVCY